MPPNLSTCANDVTGKWIANDGGVYYIRQDGNGTSWFGSTLYNDDAINSKKGFDTLMKPMAVLENILMGLLK